MRESIVVLCSAVASSRVSRRTEGAQSRMLPAAHVLPGGAPQASLP